LLLAFIGEDGETQLRLWQFDEDATVSDVTGVQGGTSSLRELSITRCSWGKEESGGRRRLGNRGR
jgi:hypothetical protein